MSLPPPPPRFSATIEFFRLVDANLAWIETCLGPKGYTLILQRH